MPSRPAAAQIMQRSQVISFARMAIPPGTGRLTPVKLVRGSLTLEALIGAPLVATFTCHKP